MVASSECKGELVVVEATRRDEREVVDDKLRRDEGMCWRIFGVVVEKRLLLHENELRRHIWS